MRRYIVCLLLLIFSSALSSCYLGRVIVWNFADVGDMNKFKKRPVTHGQDVFTFYKHSGPQKEPVIPADLVKKNYGSFDDFMLNTQTVAFLIIRNDTIQFERYYYMRDSVSPHPAFSMAKSFVSAMVGIAIEQKLITGVKDPVTKYLPELKNRGMEKITIDNLLQMRSGIKFNESYLDAFGKVAKYYYGRNLAALIPHLKPDQEPDQQFKYLSVATQLLGMIIERVTGKKLEQYLQEKIWIPLGMESDASWNIDSRKYGEVKAYCCLNATARDFAKLGRLYLNMGNWNGKQIVPKAWVERSIKPYTPGQDFYSTQWWLLGEGRFAAIGYLGQYIFVDPKTKTIIVRLGKKPGNVAWEKMFKELVSSGH